jgi:hypothetical protein
MSYEERHQTRLIIHRSSLSWAWPGKGWARKRQRRCNETPSNLIKVYLEIGWMQGMRKCKTQWLLTRTPKWLWCVYWEAFAHVVGTSLRETSRILSGFVRFEMSARCAAYISNGAQEPGAWTWDKHLESSELKWHLMMFKPWEWWAVWQGYLEVRGSSFSPELYLETSGEGTSKREAKEQPVK